MVKQDFEKEDSTALEQLAYLDSNKFQLSNKVYDLMRADILCDNLFKGSYMIRNYKDEKAIPFLTALKFYTPNLYLEHQINNLLRTCLNFFWMDVDKLIKGI